jgi:hypothetical protein
LGNPQKNLTTGLMLGTFLVIAHDLLVNFAYLKALSLSEII